MKNKPFIFLSVILFGIIVSYVVFSWSEPTGNMPTNYKPPLNTSANAQDVDPNKPVIGNLNVEKLGGYTASDLLGLIGGPASYEIVEGTTCPEGTILTSKYYAQKTCTEQEWHCYSRTNDAGNVIGCNGRLEPTSWSTGSGWALDPSKVTRWIMWGGDCNFKTSCLSDGTNCRDSCSQDDYSHQGPVDCQAPITHVLCLTVDAPE